MPPAESRRGSRCVRRRKWAARKRENAVLCTSSLHTSAGAMDRNGGDPVHEISIAELVARGSTQPPDRSKQPYHDGGDWAAGLMDMIAVPLGGRTCRFPAMRCSFASMAFLTESLPSSRPGNSGGGLWEEPRNELNPSRHNRREHGSIHTRSLPVC